MGRLSRPATVALIGPMGAGKTEVGRVLARLLGRKFRDTDAMVQRRTGMTISQIFEEDGESAFRVLESDALRDAASTAGAIIACGGGAVLDAGNVRALQAAGIVVYLKPSLAAAQARIGSGEGRPLLEGADPAAILAGILDTRDRLYRDAADYVIDADGPVDEVARSVLAALGKLPHASPDDQSLPAAPP